MIVNERRIGPEANLFRADLRGATLCGEDLRRANLRGANLRGANLCEANLCGADLREANLCEANLRGAKVCGADLCEANLFGAYLREANLCEANLRRADLRGANLCGADLREANLCEANLFGALDVFSLGSPKGWFSYAWLREELLSVRIGCREFRYDEAVQYWNNHPDGRETRVEQLAATEYARQIALARGWRIS